MDRVPTIRVGAMAWALLMLGACAVTAPSPELVAPVPAPAPPTAAIAAPVSPPPPLPEMFESEDFIVTFAKAGDTAASLAARFLGDPGKAWMVEDYHHRSTFAPGQEVVIPKRPWNLSGVEPTGYQLVPILTYHNLAPQAKGRLVLAVKSFEEQMRYLKSQGYRVISLKEFLEFTALKRQLARKSVVLTFDDGWKSFRDYAYPVLKELGFTATLFIYTDFVGARSALSWEDIRTLDREGFDIEAHTRTHGDLRRRPEESGEEFIRRMQAELVHPLPLFQRYLGHSSQILAYPYGAQDDEVMRKVREAGYIAAFTVRRQGNPAFVPLLTINRSQIYADMSLEDFAKNLNVFNEEPIK